jgi:hypothetical protein
MHTPSAAPVHGAVTFRTYIIDSIERVMDSNTTHIRALALQNSTIACRDKACFWHTLAEIASGGSADIDWHAMEYGSPLNEADHKTRYVYTWRHNCSVLKFYTKILHRANRQWLEWFVCNLAADAEHSGDDTDADEIRLEA